MGVTFRSNARAYKAAIGSSLDLELKGLAERIKQYIREEVPVDTGNLRDNTVIDDLSESTLVNILIGSDEDEAPYAPNVFLPGVSRNYGGNDWISRVEARLRADGDISDEVANAINSKLRGL